MKEDLDHRAGEASRPDAEPKHIFVYGTLMRASRSPYARLLETRARFVGEACAPGRLYNLGRFPGAVFDEAARTRIFGEVFRLNGPAVLAALDAYEGCGGVGTNPDLFYRTAIEVRLHRGGALAVWVYPYAGKVDSRPLVASGRFPL
ncbi:gamma-glutamylcyclotransferase [Rhodomicrobium vannielii ATCC 17100]|uniref:gamma-glutamylcyclotransferase family protein n=1 Tax=Rhodomicrobium vannielii TaxID=1069 RepID=UPI0019198042|nr:gamma-glutamylcyclotransferase family protein [Rhodomicrobium vannielii]MBJ7534023.1 gamma-glutamylcyclotransferase [Rhodomicrobium vannielii ATCC 17100]